MSAPFSDLRCIRRVRPETFALAKRLRKFPTLTEDVLWQRLRKKQLGPRFGRSVVILGWIADFYCPAAKLVVEVDGSSHAGRRAFDLYRDAIMRQHGFSVMRVTAKAVFHCPDAVVARIRRVLRSPSS